MTAESHREALQQRLGPVYTSDLQHHLERGVVILVAREQDLLDAAVAIAEDDSKLVGKWIESGTLRRPSFSQLEEWKDKPQLEFLSVVVQPYVLAQQMDD